MAIITLPTDLQVHQLAWGQKDQALTFSDQDTGGQQARALAPARWKATMTLNLSASPAQAAVWRSMIARLRGKTNQLALHDVKNPAPRGTMRGSLATFSSTAVGATALVVQAQRARINILKATEEFDDAFWGKLGGGTGVAPVVTPNVGTDPLGGSTADRVVLDKGAGTTTTDQSTLYALLSVTVGQPYVISVWMKTEDGSTKTVRMDFNGTAGSGATKTVTGVWTRFDNYLVATLIAHRLAIRLRGAQGTSDAATLHVWGAQQEVPPSGTAPSAYQKVNTDNVTFDLADYVQADTTLKLGDWVGVGSGQTRQLFMVQADAVADANAKITLTVEPPSRYLHAAGAAAAWDKPTCLMRRVDSEVSWSSIADAEGSVTFNLAESWES